MSDLPKLQVFLDFDGTISIGDVGDALVQTFGSFEPLHTQLLNGQFTVAEYYRRAATGFSPNANEGAVASFVDSRELDAGLVPLVKWCTDNSFPVTVVSDGFDVYIQPLLHRAGILEHVEVSSNRLSFAGGSWHPSFPGASESCSCFCASCKRNAILTRIADDDVVVYVGDGRSDACAVRFADIVFAKGTLAASCTAEGIPHHTYRSLTEVLIILQRRMKDNDFPRRRQARLARKRAYESE
jgi:2,3-diketo-5-methylthio-1-phosphopentane phosphatase